MAHYFKRLNRTLLTAAMVLALLTLASCLPVPLGDPDKSQVDSKLTGFWVDTDDANSGTMYVIAPFDSHCDMVQCVPYEKKGDRYETKSSAWRAWLTDVKGTRFMTLQSAAHMADPAYPGDKSYPTVKIVMVPGKLTFRALDSGYEKFKELKNSDQLAQIIQENLDDPKMYVEAETTLRRMDAGKESDASLMKLAIP